MVKKYVPVLSTVYLFSLDFIDMFVAFLIYVSFVSYCMYCDTVMLQRAELRHAFSVIGN